MKSTSKFIILFLLFFLATGNYISAQGIPNLCNIADPFCSDVQGGVTFPASTNSPDAESGPDYGCLFSQPNPAWYYLQIANTGPIQISMFSTPSEDIDFIIWGPFSSLSGICDPNALNASNIVDCSFSFLSTEVGNIPVAVAGEFYMFLITNFSNIDCNINFDQTGGTGSTNCAVLCEISGVTVSVGNCDPATNLYNVTGTVNFSNAPTSGTLNVTNSAGGSVSLPVSGTSQTYSFSGLTANGVAGTITATFSADANCTFTSNFTAPAACSNCVVTAAATSACAGGNIDLTASAPSALPGSTYIWNGPNGFTSNIQNPSITSATALNNGAYTVTLTSGVCTTTSTVNVTVIAIPLVPPASNSGPVCENASLSLSTFAIPGATYAWTGPQGFTSAVQNPVISPIAINQAGQYSLIVTVLGCVSQPGTTQVVINNSPAIPTLASNAPICEGITLQLNASPNLLPIQTIAWTGPLGFTSTLQNPTIAGAGLTNSGTYSAIVTQNGCSSLAGIVDVVIIQTPATPILTSNSPVCQNSSLIVDPQAYATPVTYSWSGPNGFASTASSISVASAQLADAGVYSLIVTVQNTTCSSAIGNITITVNAAPQANAGADISICPQVNGNIGSPAMPSVTYNWSPTTGLNDFTAANPIFNFTSTSSINQILTYTVTATAQNCSSTDVVEITLFPQPLATITAPIPQCFSGNSFAFAAGGQFPANSTFLWDFGPNATPASSTAQNPNSVVYSFTGQQPVSLLITSNDCASNFATINVNVLPMPVANFEADNYSGCDPMYVRFNNLSETLNGTLTYQWDLGNGLSSNLTNPTSIYSIPGSYDVKIKVSSSNGCTDIYTINGMITVNPTPEAGFLILPGQNITIIEPTVRFEDLSIGATQVEYEIVSLDVLYDFNPTYTFADTGFYFINQIVTNQFGCADTLAKEIVVDFGFKIFVPRAFSPNNDGKNDLFMAYGEDINEFDFKIFNRWGQLMFTTFDLTSGWDGTIRNSGRLATNDLYVYAIKGTDKYGRQFEVSGTVNLIK